MPVNVNDTSTGWESFSRGYQGSSVPAWAGYMPQNLEANGTWRAFDGYGFNGNPEYDTRAAFTGYGFNGNPEYDTRAAFLNPGGYAAGLNYGQFGDYSNSAGVSPEQYGWAGQLLNVSPYTAASRLPYDLYSQAAWLPQSDFGGYQNANAPLARGFSEWAPQVQQRNGMFGISWGDEDQVPSPYASVSGPLSQRAAQEQLAFLQPDEPGLLRGPSSGSPDSLSLFNLYNNNSLIADVSSSEGNGLAFEGGLSPMSNGSAPMPVAMNSDMMLL